MLPLVRAQLRFTCHQRAEIYMWLVQAAYLAYKLLRAQVPKPNAGVINTEMLEQTASRPIYSKFSIYKHSIRGRLAKKSQ